MKIITYATHSDGSFEKLKKHDITVLGFGEPWEGFIGKAKCIRKHLDELPDDELVIVIDGFDTKIIKDVSVIPKLFEKFNCKVLFSHEDKNGFSEIFPSFVHKYIINKVFGTCRDYNTANAGLYMGYTKYLKIIVDEMIKGDSDDDQRNVNKICKHYPFLKIDSDKLIFENCSTDEQMKNSKSYIVQIPGALNTTRILRGIKEYYKYFILELLVLILILCYFKWK